MTTLFNTYMIVLCPFAIWIIVSSGNDNDIQEEVVHSIDQAEDPSTTTTLTGTIFLFLILKGLLDNVLLDKDSGLQIAML